MPPPSPAHWPPYHGFNSLLLRPFQKAANNDIREELPLDNSPFSEDTHLACLSASRRPPPLTEHHQADAAITLRRHGRYRHGASLRRYFRHRIAGDIYRRIIRHQHTVVTVLSLYTGSPAISIAMPILHTAGHQPVTPCLRHFTKNISATSPPAAQYRQPNTISSTSPNTSSQVSHNKQRIFRMPSVYHAHHYPAL
jgi:hypothetical protein